MMFRVGYVEPNDGIEQWRDYIEEAKINHIELQRERLLSAVRQVDTICIGKNDMAWDDGYLLQGVHIQHLENDPDAGLLLFESDLKGNLEHVLELFDLPRPEPIRACEEIK